VRGLTAGWAGEPAPRRRELLAVAAIAALAVAVRVAYVALTTGHELAGDEVFYRDAAQLWAGGQPFHTSFAFGVVHESLQKAPLYLVFSGLAHDVLGGSLDRVLVLQALPSALTVVLTWLLGRRLVGPGAGLAAAALAAVAPNVWQYDVRLYSEVLATPATLALLVVLLDREPTWARTALVGALLGVNLLVRPSALLLVAAIAVAWWLAAGPWRGTLRTAAAVAVAALVVAPWTVRNASVDPDHLIPISIQDAALYGTFNDEAADDPTYPYKWRPVPASYRDVFGGPPLGDGALHQVLRDRALDWIAEHPDSVPKALWYNGITRLWDLRPPGQIVDAGPQEGRERALATAGLVAYWLLLPLVAVALWRLRTRPAVLLPLLAMAAAASVVYVGDAGTRYRAPFEPVLVLLACAGAAALLARRRTGAGAVA
jgi:4-amino-4-deoxy-L-arabinose transferase-like glycosyltransferase